MNGFQREEHPVIGSGGGDDQVRLLFSVMDSLHLCVFDWVPNFFSLKILVLVELMFKTRDAR